MEYTHSLTREDLRIADSFADLSEEALDWMLAHGYEESLAEGDHVFTRGEAPRRFFLLLKGRIQVFAPTEGRGEDLRPVFVIEPGRINGYLPYSRMQESRGNGVATEPSRIFAMDKKHFREMGYVHPEIVEKLVWQMLDRTRDFAQLSAHETKLAALGKMSASLAHELNNPAAAIKSNAIDLYEKLTGVPQHIQKLLETPPSMEEMQNMFQVFKDKMATGEVLELSLAERADLEDEMADWLEDRGAEDGYSMAECFMDMNMCVEDLDKLEGAVSARALPAVLNWLQHFLTIKRGVMEIKEASSRISGLVAAIKSYTHMDKSTKMERVQMEDGIRNTFMLLQHKLKKKNIQLELQFQEGLPAIMGMPGELNQIWTNLLDNSIHALPENGGKIDIKANRVGDFVQVKFIDNGSGIPKEIQNRIFEPFFSTKKQGEGTGIGLDMVQKIVKNHNGDIRLDSEPGRTEFLVCIPAIKN